MSFKFKGLEYPCPMWQDVVRNMDYGFNQQSPNRIDAIKQTLRYMPWKFRFHRTFFWHRDSNGTVNVESRFN